MAIDLSEHGNSGSSGLDLGHVQQKLEATLAGERGSEVNHPTSSNSKLCTTAVFRDEELLSEELLEKILARVRFPALYKCGLLSKRWYSKFSFPLERLECWSEPTLQEVKTCSSPLMKEEISKVSSNWDTYSPVYFTENGIRGFDRESLRWKYMPNVSHFLMASCRSYQCRPTSAGSLVCIMTDQMQSGEPASVFVTNVLTRQWRRLPRDHMAPRYLPCHVKIVAVYTADNEYSHYKVLLFCKVPPDENDIWLPWDEIPWNVETHVYDSSLPEGKRWSLKASESNLTDSRIFDNSVYLHGKLFLMSRPLRLWCWNVDSDNAWITIPHSFRRNCADVSYTFVPLPDELLTGGFLLCGQKVMLVLWYREFPRRMRHDLERYTPANIIHIFQVDLESLQLVEVCSGPPMDMVGVGLFKKPHVGMTPPRYPAYFCGDIGFASDNNFIYFGDDVKFGHNCNMPLMTYNLDSGEWDRLSLAQPSMNHKDIPSQLLSSAFEPGRNPFASV